MRLLPGFLRFAVTAAAIPVCANLMDGVTVLNLQNALIVGVGLAVIYTLVRPLLRLILSVLNFCLLGLLNIGVDAWLVWTAAVVVKNSVAFDNFWWALAVAVAVNAARTVIDTVFGKNRH